jgi:hypothetical protein
MTALKAGWNNGFWQAKPHTTEDVIDSQLGDIREKAAGWHIPRLTRELISTALHGVHQVTQSKLLGIFGDYLYVGLSLDPVTITSRKFLNIARMNLVSNTPH